MNVQYISDDTGKTTGVFIPISDWNELKNQFNGIEQLEIPNWQKEEVEKMLKAYKANPEEVIDFDKALEEIENEL